MSVTINTKINGQSVIAGAEASTSLLEFLRDTLEYKGTKLCCNTGECGACTIIYNGKPINSCVTLAADANGAEITTIEGLADGDKLHPVQQAFIDTGAVQCGYCTPGYIISVKALLIAPPNPRLKTLKKRCPGKHLPLHRLQQNRRCDSTRRRPNCREGLKSWQNRTKIIGTSPARMGGIDRVIGKGVYGIDLMLKDQLHGAILRSQYAHAKIVSIDTSEAKKIPGVHAVVTAADAPHVRYGRSYFDRHILARHKVRFMGDPVAAVAATSPAIAKQALKKIKVVYEPLPVALDPEEATKPNAPTLHEDMPLPKTIPTDAGLKNICGHAVVHVGDAEKAMAEADIVVDEVYETKMIHPQYLEPRIAAAQMEPNGRLTVWANAQAPFPVRQEVAKMLGLQLNNVRVISAGLGGGFGGKGSGITSGAAVELICGLLAIKAKRPVMIVLDKAEETISTTIRSGARMYIKTGVKKDGTIVARTGKVFYDAGGYSGFGVQAGGRCTNMLGGWYLMPNCHIEGYSVYTNKQVCGPVRGPGGPQAAFAVESHMDSIAAKLGMDPTEFRLKNIPKAGENRRAQAARCFAG